MTRSPLAPLLVALFAATAGAQQPAPPSPISRAATADGPRDGRRARLRERIRERIEQKRESLTEAQREELREKLRARLRQRRNVREELRDRRIAPPPPRPDAPRARRRY